MATYENNVDHDNLKRPDAMLFLRSIRAAIYRHKLWGASWLFLLLLSAIPAMEVMGTVNRIVGNRYASSDAARELHSTLSSPTVGMSEIFRQDHGSALSQMQSSLSYGGAALALVALLFGCFAAGGWLQITFEQPDRQTLRRFAFGGGRYFGRFVRVAVMTVLLLALVRWVLYGEPWKRVVYGWFLDVPKYDWGSLETLPSEQKYTYLMWTRDGLAAIGFAKVLAWGIYTRTRLVLRDSRSVIGAGIATWYTMVRHPIQTMRPLILLLLVEVLIVVGILGWWNGTVETRFYADANGWHVLAFFGIAQLGVIWRQVTRGAYYHSAGRVSQALILPTDSKPDPWAKTIGGPGGPQYPIDDDGYHVTV
ncbi:MAG: hypothetical protein ACJAQ3_003389 [Planctomycetota bacterium]|jgi:hypothetical protein